MKTSLFNFIGALQEKPVYPPLQIIPKNYYNKNMNFYVCSSGGCGSTIIYNYLSNFGKVYHIHDRYPPSKLTYVGRENTDEDVYSEWFNRVEIPEDKLNNYKVIFLYRNPLQVIYSRFAQRYGPNVNHLKHIKCDNNGNIHLFDVLKSGKDLYKIEEFFNNYVSSKERNYDIYCLKYELFWNNISLFNKVMGLPDITQLYPEKKERPKQIQFQVQLNKIYTSLLLKMNTMRFIEVIPKTRQILENNEEV
jgi:hypothetical protein